MAAPAAPPPPPPGFTIESGPPPPPPGFTLEGTPAVAQSRASAARDASYNATDLAGSKFTMGLADKVPAAAGAVSDAVHNAFNYFTGDHSTDRNIGVRYDSAVAVERHARDTYAAAHPIVDWATAPLNLAGAGPAATGIASAARAAVAAGGISGMMGALGGDNPTPLKVMGGGIAGGLVGGGVNAAASVLTGAASRVGSTMRAITKAVAPAADTLANASGKSQSIIANAIKADGNTPSGVASMIDDASKRGVPLSIADTGDNARALAASVGRQAGPSRTIVRDAVVARHEGQAERVQGAIQRDLGPTTGVATEAQRLEESAKGVAGPIYDRAYAHGQIDDPIVNQLLEHPEMRRAAAAGAQLHANDTFMANVKGEEPPPPLARIFTPKSGSEVSEDPALDAMFRPSPDQNPGGYDVRTPPDVRTLDYIKRGLDANINAAYSGTDAQAKMSAPFLKDLRSTLLGRVDAHVPDYAEARAAYGGPMRSAEALAMGKAAVSKSGDQIAAETADLSPAELDQYRLGHRSGMSDLVSATPDGADKVKRLLGSPQRREALAQLYGGDEGLKNFTDTLADEAKTSATHAAVNTGSPSAERISDDALSSADSTVQKMGSAGLKAVMGRPVGALGELVALANDKVARKAGEGVRAELAATLSETNPRVLSELLRERQVADLRANLANTMRAAHAGKAVPVVAATAGRAVGQTLQ